MHNGRTISRRTTFLLAAVILATGVTLVGCGDATPEPTPAEVAALTPVERGHQLYINNCASCHGTNLKGMPRQGTGLLKSALVKKSDEGALARFIARGRLPGDPESQMGLLMPPKGGNSSLQQEQLRDIAIYLKSVTAEPAATQHANTQ